MIFGKKLLYAKMPLKAKARKTGIILWAFLHIITITHIIAIGTVISITILLLITNTI